MKIDIEKIQRYLQEIKARHREIDELMQKMTDAEILKEPWVVKGLKYSIIEIAEAMANTLQHILAKDMGEPVTGYVETIIRSGEMRILPERLSNKMKPFFDFRNSLIHRYWYISDIKLISLIRENKMDFLSFIDATEKYIKRENKGVASSFLTGSEE
jgi:uncharacterized protein YutE (UPF0331/DUF86 family)